MRPSKGDVNKKTIRNFVHLDMNPLTGATSFFGYRPS